MIILKNCSPKTILSPLNNLIGHEEDVHYFFLSVKDFSEVRAASMIS